MGHALSGKQPAGKNSGAEEIIGNIKSYRDEKEKVVDWIEDEYVVWTNLHDHVAGINNDLLEYTIENPLSQKQ